MPRLPNVIAVGLAAALLASCAKSGLDGSAPPEDAAASAEPAALEVALDEAAVQADGDIVITGARIRRPNLESAVPVTSIGGEEFFQTSNRVRSSSLPAYQAPEVGRDRFASVVQNGFKVALEEPVSTFSIDVDTASYSFVRAALNRNVLPQQAAVRTEEMINYFPYDYEAPSSASEAVQQQHRRLPQPVDTGPQARPHRHQGLCRPTRRTARANLVFLIDTSGSMNAPNKLPLVQQSLSLLLDQLRPRTASPSSLMRAAPAHCSSPRPPASARRSAPPSTGSARAAAPPGSEGIRQAYALATRNLDPRASTASSSPPTATSTSASPSPRRSRTSSSASARRACSCPCSASEWAITTTS
jgi:Ca-activated chloride channel family protein